MVVQKEDKQMKKINVILCRSKIHKTYYYDMIVLAMKKEEEAKELVCQLNDIVMEKDANELRTVMVKNTMLIPSFLQGEIYDPDIISGISFYTRQCILK